MPTTVSNNINKRGGGLYQTNWLPINKTIVAIIDIRDSSVDK